MTAQEFCRTHEPITQCSLFEDETIYIHGIEYGGGDFVYISDVYGDTIKYHKLKIVYRKSGQCFVLNGTPFYLEQCIPLSKDFRYSK